MMNLEKLMKNYLELQNTYVTHEMNPGELYNEDVHKSIVYLLKAIHGIATEILKDRGMLSDLDIGVSLETYK